MAQIEASSETAQNILPGFQTTLRLAPDKTSVPAAHVDNLAETESLFDLNDVRRVIIDLGICKPEEVDGAIIGERRQGRWASDIIAGVFLARGAMSDPILRQKFEQLYGVSYSFDNLHIHGFGGSDFEDIKANLPRTPEDERLDQEIREEDHRIAVESNRKYLGDLGEIPEP